MKIAHPSYRIVSRILALAMTLALPLTSIASAPKTGAKPFSSPYATLQKGPVRFFCWEVTSGMKGGGGRNVFQFDVALGSPDRGPNSETAPRENEVTLSQIQMGTQGFELPPIPGKQLPIPQAPEWQSLSLGLLKNSGGEIIAPGSPFERLNFNAYHEGAPLAGENGPEWKYELNVQQDQDTKLVFAKYETTYFAEGRYACSGKPSPCERRQRAMFNNTYLCSPQ